MKQTTKRCSKLLSAIIALALTLCLLPLMAGEVKADDRKEPGLAPEVTYPVVGENAPNALPTQSNAGFYNSYINWFEYGGGGISDQKFEFGKQYYCVITLNYKDNNYKPFNAGDNRKEKIY